MQETKCEIKDKLIQVSFSCEANIEVVESQLLELVKLENTEFICCFLNRKMVEAKHFDTSIVDVLENTLGKKLTWMADKYDNDCTSFLSNLDNERMEVAKQIDHIYVLDSATAKGVAKEIELFSLGRVVLM